MSEQEPMAAGRGDAGSHVRPGAGNVGLLGDAAQHLERDAGGAVGAGDASASTDAGDAGDADDAAEPGDDACVRSGVERCNARDDDCDGKTDEGFDVGGGCDGPDDDACADGVLVCDGDGLVMCDESAENSAELCDGIDNDCDGKSDEDFALGDACDGADGDLCADGEVVCDGPRATRCSDDDGSALELCNGLDDDCNPATADGSDEATLGDACDGDDRDACAEGLVQCVGRSLRCSDVSGDSLELCNGLDDDCDARTADGAAEAQLGMACDGSDADVCKEGTFSCAGNAGLRCSDDADALCAAAINLGSVRGDVSGDRLTASGHGEAWYALTVTDTAAESSDNAGGTPYLSATVELESAAGTDFDLDVYCQRCGGALAGSSDFDQTETDFVDVRVDDAAARVDTFDVLIHVLFFEAAACADWTLKVRSNLTVATKTCN